MSAAGLILRKELHEIRRSPVLLASMISLPTTTVVVPVALVAYLAHAAPAASVAFIQQIYGLGAGAPIEVLVRAAATNWLPVFLVMPVFLPILLAAQSIGGERERRTLEPLLATPVSTTAIVVGKSVGAVIPALAITWLSAGVFVGALDALAGHALLPDAAWAFAVAVLAPLLALFGNAVAVAVSARVTDPRAAQNLAAMTVVPLLGLVVAQIAGKVHLGLGFYLALAAGLAVADVVLVAVAARLFDRERLLTRWR